MQEINQKYSHLYIEKVLMTLFLFRYDVSQSVKQIEESEKPKNKFSFKNKAPTWHFPAGRTRSFSGKPCFRGFSSRFQPFGLQTLAFRGGYWPSSAQPDMDSKSARSRGNKSQQ